MHTSTNITEDLFRLLREKGAKLIGIADLSGIAEGTLTTGISVAVPVPRHIVRDLQDSPTKEYFNQSFCGACSVCVESCPGKALTGKSWDTQTTRTELFHKEICKETQIRRMKQATGIETDLCGLCFAVCTYTKRYLAES